jgi:hypothetical protein
MPQGTIPARRPSGEAKARRRIVRTQACDGAKVRMEKHAAKRCQVWNSGERIADVPHSPHHWQMEAIFSPAAQNLFDHCASDDLLSLSSLFLPHCFLARVETIVLFFLEDNK